MRGSSGPGRAFTIFAFMMVGALVLGSVVVFGGAILGGSDPSGEPTPGEGLDQETRRLETRVAENPDDGESAGVLANIYAQEGRFEEAFPLFERALEQGPDDAGVRLAFGIALFRAGNEFDARVQLERAYELESDKSGPAYYLGQLEENRADPDLEEARLWYERAIEASPESLVADEARTRLEEIDAQIEGTATPTAE